MTVTVIIVERAVVSGTFTNTASASSGTTDLSLNDNTPIATAKLSDNPNAPYLSIVLSCTNALLSWSTNAPGCVGLVQARSHHQQRVGRLD